MDPRNTSGGREAQVGFHAAFHSPYPPHPSQTGLDGPYEELILPTRTAPAMQSSSPLLRGEPPRLFENAMGMAQSRRERRRKVGHARAGRIGSPPSSIWCAATSWRRFEGRASTRKSQRCAPRLPACQKSRKTKPSDGHRLAQRTTPVELVPANQRLIGDLRRGLSRPRASPTSRRVAEYGGRCVMDYASRPKMSKSWGGPARTWSSMC